MSSTFSIRTLDETIILMISHQTNQSKDICDVDHMPKSAPAAPAPANYPMFVINPFSVISVMMHNSAQKYMFILLPKPRNQTILICVQFGFIKLILLFAF